MPGGGGGGGGVAETFVYFMTFLRPPLAHRSHRSRRSSSAAPSRRLSLRHRRRPVPTACADGWQVLWRFAENFDYLELRKGFVASEVN